MISNYVEAKVLKDIEYNDYHDNSRFQRDNDWVG